MQQRRGKLSFANRDIAVARYVAGEPLKEIAASFGVTDMAIVRHARARGITLRGRHRLPVDHSAFNDLTDEAAYWVGFLMSDGCVIGNRIFLQLAGEDGEHILSFRKWLKSEHAITVVPAHEAVFSNERGIYTAHAIEHKRFAFCSDKIAARLADFGITERKSTTAAPTAAIASNRHFWRGMMDGDGCFGLWGQKRRRIRLALCGSRPSIEAFQNYCRPITRTNGSVFVRKNGLTYFFLTGERALDIIRELYTDAPIALPRKAVIAAKLLS